jgi:hypothetical protein
VTVPRHSCCRPPHGGYPGEITVQDEYLACVECRWCCPLDQGDDECGVRRMTPNRDVLLRQSCPRVGVELYPGRWAKSCMAYGRPPLGPYFFVTVYYPTSRPR